MLDIVHEPLTGLPATTAAGRGRAAALEVLAGASLGTAGFVEYQAGNTVLIAGPADRALEAARVLADSLRCFIVADDDAPADADLAQYLLARGRPRVHGHLGAFEAWLDSDRGPVAVAGLAHGGLKAFDLVLDLGSTPLITVEKPPIGYQAPGVEPAAVAEALALLPDLVGEFQKPRFFAYDENICAHGARGITGCTNCLDACATGAITSLGEAIGVDPYLCQGCGSCATACPSGAIRYAYPEARELLGAIRRALKAWSEQADAAPALLFHDEETGAAAVAAMAEALPERLLPIPVEDVGGIGPDVWLTALALGASDVRLLLPDAAEPSLVAASQTQYALFAPVLDALQLGAGRVGLLRGSSGLAALAGQDRLHDDHGRRVERFSIAGGKRERLQTAFSALYRPHSDAATTALPAGAPFGQIVVDRDACTLCMACAAVCPVEAVTSGGAEPTLLFDESRCLQCGLCERACPEDAIELEARLHLPAFARTESRVLNEETPFHCVSCGTAFATEKMINRVAEQLAGHWMFQDERARRRLEMCEDCRVKDLFDDEGTGLGR